MVRFLEAHKENYDAMVLRLLNNGADSFKTIAYGQLCGNAMVDLSVSQMLPALKKAGVNKMCMFLDTRNQPGIDDYLKTGDNSYLEQVISAEDRYQPGPPHESDRYYEILQVAYHQGIKVHAVTARSGTRKFLAHDIIPKSGKTLIYVPQGYLCRVADVKGLNKKRTYFVWNMLSSETGKFPKNLKYLINGSGSLKYRRRFALDLTNPEVEKILGLDKGFFRDYFTLAGIPETAKVGVVYHNKAVK